jgi:hypothetical protein
MSDGKISGNTARTGGGVYVGNGSFTMSGGEISGNTASATATATGSGSTYGHGGGVYVYITGDFTKTGGIIYGDTDNTHTPNGTENTAVSGNTCGHAVGYAITDAGGPPTICYRDDTLTDTDDISTGDTLPANPGDTLNNWTKQ